MIGAHGIGVRSTVSLACVWSTHHAQKVEEAIRVLTDLRETFQDAEPAEVRELLAPQVAKVELHFDHERHGKLERNPFRHGTVFVRPTEPQLSMLLGNSESHATYRSHP